MPKLIIITNPATPTDAEVIETDNRMLALFERFSGQLPEGGRLYRGNISQVTDITPNTADEVDQLEREIDTTWADDPIYLVVYPGFFIALIAVLVLAVVLTVALILLMPQPQIPNTASRQRNQESPNNSLTNRTNQSRLGSRIPDIFGKLLSVPDLLGEPYLFFDDNTEVEVAYLCLGRGSYEVDEVFDGDTRIAEISGASVGVYGPGTSPGFGSAELQIGTAISDGVVSSRRLNEVNGQSLRAPDANQVNGSSDIRFLHPDTIQHNISGLDFEEYFVPGDTVSLINAAFTEETISFDLNGTYTIVSLTSDTITLSNPALVAPDWNTLDDLSDDISDYYSPSIISSSDKFVGPFVTRDVVDEIWCNVVAPQGLYRDDGNNQYRINIGCQVEVTPVDANGDPTGAAQISSLTINGSAFTRTQRGGTVRHVITGGPSRASVRMRRTTNKVGGAGTVAQEIQWRDMYAIQNITPQSYGDVTTIHARTVATQGALAVKERQIRCLVTRKLPQRVSGSTFTTELFATRNAADILSAIALDPEIGNRSASEIDFDGIYGAIAEVEAYFGNAEAAEFAHTFDTDQISFQETFNAVCAAVFCSGFRLGNLIGVRFEGLTRDATGIVNHRNKIPRRETRTFSFGTENAFDGVELEYIDPADDTIAVYRIPEAGAINPKKVEVLGLRTERQAYWHAWRTWNKINYQSVSTEMRATDDALLLARGDRILATRGTAPGSLEGDVLSQDGLVLKLSQPCDVSTGSWRIFLWMEDGVVDSIGVQQGNDEFHVVLALPPRYPIVTGADRYSRTKFALTQATDATPIAALIVEKRPRRDGTVDLGLVNYDWRYYLNDQAQLWMPAETDLSDQSHQKRTLTLAAGVEFVADAERIGASEHTASTEIITVAGLLGLASYTKAAWIKKTVGQNGAVLSGVDERFGTTGGASITVSHTATVVAQAAYPDDGEWHHVAATYDAASGDLSVYVDGVLGAAESEVAQRTLSTIAAVGDGTGDAIIGLVSDLRMYSIALTDEETIALYRATKA